MFIVNSALSSLSNEIPNVFVVCHNDEDYLKLLRDVKANFFVPTLEDLGWSPTLTKRESPVYSHNDLPPNFTTVENLDVPFLSYCSCVLVLNNHKSFAAGLSISHQCKAPIVRVNLLSDDLSYTRPFGTTVQPHPLATGPEHFRVPVWTQEGLMLYLQDTAVETSQEFASFTINNRIPHNILARFTSSLPVEVVPLYRDSEKVVPSQNFFIETLNGFSMSLFECMHNNCVVFVPRNKEHETLIQDGVNGFLYGDFQELHEKINLCVEADTQTMGGIAQQANKTISNEITAPEQFTEHWNNFLFDLSKHIPRN